MSKYLLSVVVCVLGLSCTAKPNRSTGAGGAKAADVEPTCECEAEVEKVHFTDYVKYELLDGRNTPVVVSYPVSEQFAETLVNALAWGISRTGWDTPFYYYVNGLDQDMMEAYGNSVMRVSADATTCGNNYEVATSISKARWSEEGFVAYCLDDQSDGMLIGVNRETGELRAISPHD